MQDKKDYIVVLDGYVSFIPVRESYRVKTKRRAIQLKRRLLKQRKEVSRKRVRIVKNGIAHQLFIQEDILKGI